MTVSLQLVVALREADVGWVEALVVSIPRVLAVKVTRQVLEVVPGVSVQGLGATAELEPDGLVETTKLTMPRGADRRGPPLNSSHARQANAVFSVRKTGQSNVVEVVRACT